METAGSEHVRVTVLPHPFSEDGERHDMPAGLSVRDIISRVRPGAAPFARAWIGGHFIPAGNWARVYPKPGAALELRLVPQGGGGGGRKNPARLVVSLALSAFAPLIAPASSLFGHRALSLAMNFAGRLLFNALSPPARPRFSAAKESPTLFIQGARNAAAPFARVPRVLGTHRMVPPLGASAYTETAGNDQYLRMLFVWGYGPLEISDLKIGETPLSDFADIEIETRQGYPDDAPIALYSDSVLQNDLEVPITHAGGYAVRTSDADADELSVDITFPRGLFVVADSGAKTPATVTMTVGYSPAGAGTWTDETFTWTAAQGAALRKNARFTVARGQYDVRVSRVTADAAVDTLVDDAVWTALRTIRYAAPVRMTGIALTALRIRATDQLNGVIERFNGVVSSVLPDWDGAAWTPRATSNPAALYRHALQGAANARPLDDGRIDLEKLEAWHEACGAGGREFNAVIDYDISVREVLQAVAAAGRASPAVADGKWSVAVDAPQGVPVQHFTPRNTWGFSGEKSFDEAPHALRVRFINRGKGWLQDEILAFDDGHDAATATKYDVLELTGVTSAAQAWKDARYHIASARLRPETYGFHADIEHIVCARGDLVRFTHDVPLFGLAAARVKSVGASGGNAVSVTLDAALIMEAGRNYAVRFRLQDGTSLVMPLVTAEGTAETFQFASPCPAADGPQAGDLALFGESGQESVELIVKAIEPHGDLAAKITCVDAAPAVHAADSGDIPAFSPQITVPPEMQRPPAPVVAGIRTEQGTAFITLAPPVFPLPLSLEARLRHPEETDFRAARLTASGAEATIADLTPGLHYDLALFYKNVSGVSSETTVIPNVLIAGTGGIPANVANLSLNIIGETAHLSWSAVPDADLDHYRVKFCNATTGASWANAFEVVAKVSRAATTAALPAQVGTWLIKAVNAAGHESLNAAEVVSTLDRVDGYTVRVTADETPGFSGAMTAGSTDVAFTGDHRLVLDGAMAGTYVFGETIDLFYVYPSLLTATIDVIGVNTENLVDGWNGVDLVEDWDGAEDPSTWGVQLQLRTTNDDPDVSPTWSGWRNFSVGQYTARAFQFRLQMESEVAGVTPSVSALKVDLSMFDWAQGRSDLTGAASDSGGTRVDYPDGFYDYTAVTVTPHDLAAGDYYTLSGRDWSGFTIKFFDSSDTRVTRTFDYIATGIGRKVT
jgi:hypothetical protein